MSSTIPISHKQTIQATQWLLDNFSQPLNNAVYNKPYKVEHLCAIACQETAYRWIKWIDRLDTAEILERCVLDASGDYPNTSRNARPRNTAEFRSAFGDDFTDMLIEEANKMRRVMGWSDKKWVYKGYGIFQYDLQFSYDDPAFFRQKQWYDFENCLNKATMELDHKLTRHNGDLWEAIRAYNGSGSRARQYRENVKKLTVWCRDVISSN